jgi:hypothetical protein
MTVETVFPVFHKPRSGTIFLAVLVFTSVDYTVRGRKAFVRPHGEKCKDINNTNRQSIQLSMKYPRIYPLRSHPLPLVYFQ